MCDGTEHMLCLFLRRGDKSIKRTSRTPYSRFTIHEKITVERTQFTTHHSPLTIMLQITSRLPDIGTTIFDVMTKMANENGAINLSQGFPDFDIDPKLVSLVSEFMRKGYNQYATMPGVAPLRQIISEVIFKSYGHRANWETDITVTS